MSHTPGPWRIQKHQGIRWIMPGSEHAEPVVSISRWGSDDDARLIAAAPDLLAFAESVVTLFAKEYPQAGLHLDMDKASLLNAAREVIKKASGE